MSYLRSVLILVLFTVAGCNLSTSSNTETSTQVSTLPTQQPVITTEEVSNQAPPTAQPSTSNNTCTPRADWTVMYTIVSGDTLADIARRANTNLDALTQGNCLANPNNINVGQQLRLPQTPLSNALPPTSSALTYVTYTNTLPGLGIAFEFPSTWTILDNPNDLSFQGSNGSSFEILYSDAGQTTPPDQVANECKNTGACVANRRVISESPITLSSGLTGYRLDLSANTTAGSTPMSETFMIVNNRNLAVRGFGDLSIYNNILNSIRLYLP
ncbi:MAG: LysM peptidoglycan-binding domain-containing protein [Chloroflexota bacterium]